jgi:hypothetical protein
MKKLISTFFNHERYQTISFIVTFILLIWFYGCEPECPSPTDPEKQITRAELQIEIDTFIARSENSFADLAKQEELRNLLFQQALLAGQTGIINPFALFTSIGAILGIGATVDNVRKRKTLKKYHITE